MFISIVSLITQHSAERTMSNTAKLHIFLYSQTLHHFFYIKRGFLEERRGALI